MLDIVEIVVARIFVTGRVQGVGFRFFAVETAEEFGITGWVKNLSDGRVEVEAQGVKESVEAMIERMRQGSLGASVTDVDVTWLPDKIRTHNSRNFQIVR